MPIITNIEDLHQGASNKLLELRPKEFIFKNQLTQKKHIGLIAQEVMKILPEVIYESDNKYNISYGNMSGLLVQGIKELNERLKIN